MKNKEPEILDILIGGEIITVTIKWNKTAKRLIMRVDPRSGDVAVTLPHRASLREARKFLDERTGWILDQRDNIIAASPLEHGSVLDFMGEEHDIVFTNAPPRKIWCENEILYVGGPSDHAPARLQRWLRKQAKEILLEACARHAETLDLEYNSLAVADTKSRWGSCSSKKNLRFSWRLVLAPPEILNYVAAHEVAHLREMNHSKAFWKLVELCDPDCQQHRHWLKSEGQRLFSMGNV